MWFCIDENKKVIGISIKKHDKWFQTDNYPENIMEDFDNYYFFYNEETDTIYPDGEIDRMYE